MKQKILICLFIILFIGLLVGLNLFLNSRTNEILKESEYGNTENIASAMISNEANDIENAVVENVVSKNEVIEVTEENFEEVVLNSDKTVLIDFYATWCQPCQIMSPIIEDIAEENPDIKVVKIDVDEEVNIAYEYEIYSIPTFVVIKNGEVTSSVTGITKKQNILKMVK